MRRFLLPVLLPVLLVGCSTAKLGPHRIDVQQGNALDQENVARLKPGLNRSQVRFLLGTPLVVDPFRTDRWDYVYVYYKAGRLAEQKRITLFFEGDTLARIEGDLPEPAAPTPKVPTPAPNPAPTSGAVPTPVAAPVSATPGSEKPAPAVTKPTSPAVATIPAKAQMDAAPQPASGAPVAASPAPAVKSGPAVAKAEPAANPRPAESPKPAAAESIPASSVVPPLASPKNVPAYVDPHPPAEPALQAETDVERIRPDVIPPFPEPNQPAASDDAVLKAVNDWAHAWSARDDEKYLAAYDASFVPQGGGSRAEWEKRRRLLLGVAKNIELKVDSPSVERADDGTVTVTFNQFYRSDSYRDAVVKQLRMVERGGRWLIVEEKVLSTLRGVKP